MSLEKIVNIMRILCNKLYSLNTFYYCFLKYNLFQSLFKFLGNLREIQENFLEILGNFEKIGESLRGNSSKFEKKIQRKLRRKFKWKFVFREFRKNCKKKGNLVILRKFEELWEICDNFEEIERKLAWNLEIFQKIVIFLEIMDILVKLEEYRNISKNCGFLPFKKFSLSTFLKTKYA